MTRPRPLESQAESVTTRVPVHGEADRSRHSGLSRRWSHGRARARDPDGRASREGGPRKGHTVRRRSSDEKRLPYRRSPTLARPPAPCLGRITRMLTLDTIDRHEALFARAFAARDLEIVRPALQPDVAYVSPTVRLSIGRNASKGVVRSPSSAHDSRDVTHIAYRCVERALVTDAPRHTCASSSTDDRATPAPALHVSSPIVIVTTGSPGRRSITIRARRPTCSTPERVALGRRHR